MTREAMTTDCGLAGCRVLVVEDEAVIALMIEQSLLDLGCNVIGPVGKLSAAIELAATADIDIGVLDVTIRGGKVYPVAEILRSRRIPFVLASGYGDWALPEGLKDQPRLAKPFSMTELKQGLLALYHRDTVGRDG